jgi:hypothetical protein
MLDLIWLVLNRALTELTTLSVLVLEKCFSTLSLILSSLFVLVRLVIGYL